MKIQCPTWQKRASNPVIVAQIYCIIYVIVLSRCSADHTQAEKYVIWSFLAKLQKFDLQKIPVCDNFSVSAAETSN